MEEGGNIVGRMGAEAGSDGMKRGCAGGGGGPEGENGDNEGRFKGVAV